MASNDHKPGLVNSIQEVKGRREGRTTIILEINAIYNQEVTIYRLYEDLRWIYVELSKTVLNGRYAGCILPPLPKIPSAIFNTGSFLSQHYLQSFCLSIRAFLELLIQHPKFSQESCVERFFSQDKLPNPVQATLGSSIKEEASKMFSSIKFTATHDPDKVFIEYKNGLTKYYDTIRECFVHFSTKAKVNERLMLLFYELTKHSSHFANVVFFKDSPKEYNTMVFLEEYLEFARANLESTFAEVDQNICLFFEYYTSYTVAALNMLERRNGKLDVITQLSKKNKDIAKTAQLLDKAHDELEVITKTAESELMLLQHQKTMSLYDVLKHSKLYHVRKGKDNVQRLKELIMEVENL